MSVTIDDCVAKLRALKGKKVQPAKNKLKRTPPSQFVLGRLVTIGAIDADFVPATKAHTIQERDAILYWDNALCLQKPELREHVTVTRHLEMEAKMASSALWDSELWHSELGDTDLLGNGPALRLRESRKVTGELKDFVCL